MRWWKNRRHHKTEKKLARALRKIIERRIWTLSVRVAQICRKAGVSRATFYRHYRGIDGMMRQKSRAIKADYRRLLRELKKPNGRGVWGQTLVFIYQNREFFLVEMRRKNVGVLVEMIEEMKERFHEEWLEYEEVVIRDLIQIYTHGVIGVLLAWGEEKLQLDKLERYLGSIRWLTETVERKLMRASQSVNKVVK